MSKPVIELTDLVCGYRKNEPVVGPMSVSIPQSKVLCLVGPNGIGKTTLFKTLMGLLPPLSGSYRIAGKPANEYSKKEHAKKIAYVPQNHIPPFPYLVKDVVVMGRNPHLHELSSPSEKDYELGYENLHLLGIEALANRDYVALSGGERQLVLIARALTQQSEVLMMDEPTSHLDYGNEMLVLDQISHLAELGLTIVMITHNPSHALQRADLVCAIGPDGFFEFGAPSHVLTDDTLRLLYRVDIELPEITVRKTGKKVRVLVPTTI